MIEYKKCKGTGKAKGYGCGIKSNRRHYGLCPDCYRDWLLNTPEGKEQIKRSTIRGKKFVEKETKIRNKEQKQSIKNKAYFEGKLQDLVNEIVRMIDAGKGCISCSHGWLTNWTRMKHAGHRLSVGSNASLRFNILNIFSQCSVCNNFKSGNEREFDKGLLEHYGPDQVEKVTQLKAKYPELHLTILDLQEAIKNAREVKKRILAGEDFTREQINELIGIYT